MGNKSFGVKLGLAALVTFSAWTMAPDVAFAAPAPAVSHTITADWNGSKLVADEPTTGTVRITTDYLNVRSGPSTDTFILGVLNIGTKVEGVQEGSWFKLSYNGQTAYVHSDYLRNPEASAPKTEAPAAPQAETVTRFTTDNLNVRTGQGTSFNILGVLSRGTKVEGVDLGEWFRIEYNGQTAYVHTDYLRGSSQEAQEVADNTQADVRYTTAHLNVRKGPSIRYGILGVLAPGTKVEGRFDGHWFRISYAGETAYVSGSYLTDEKPTEQAPEQTETRDSVTRYTTASLNVRKGPGTGHSILGVLAPGTEVSGYANDGWFEIEYQGEKAFVSESYLTEKKAAPAPTPSVSSGESSSILNAIVADAKAQLGKSYVYGTAGPGTFDCSGLTYYLYNKHAGIQLPRSSASQATAGTSVSASEMRPGDLIFFINPGASRVGHVAIYIGDGKYLHASTPERGVVTDPVSGSYFQNHAVSIKRILP